LVYTTGGLFPFTTPGENVVKLYFLGAAGTVTGSRYLLDNGKTRLLVDCGLFQGHKNLRLRNWEEPPFNPRAIDAVLLTHAHLDHAGQLPLLAKRGFRGKIHCSEETAELCKLLLRDSAHLQEEEAEYANRHRLGKHAPALPLYDSNDVALALQLFQPVPDGQLLQLAPNIAARWIPNGHILGSCAIGCSIDGIKLVFSGDLGRAHDIIMKAPQPVTEADYLVVESTYGNRTHLPADPAQQLQEIIGAAVERGGSVLLPAFAVGRAQTMLYLIHQLMQQKRIPHMPVYLDSPMSTSATQLYRRFAHEMQIDADDCEAMIAMTRFVDTPDASRRINSERWPKIVISASGMATGGRVLHHLKNMAPDARNAIVFCGYQAGGTRGATLVGGAATVRIHGEDVPVRAPVFNLDTLSAHADCNEIIGWLRNFKAAPVRTFITHGEPDAADAMRLKIERELKWACHVPQYLDGFVLEKDRCHPIRPHLLD
jgi:metallo-beta-lactamase family protein